jgi:hypothetical protein
LLDNAFKEFYILWNFIELIARLIPLKLAEEKVSFDFGFESSEGIWLYLFTIFPWLCLKIEFGVKPQGPIVEPNIEPVYSDAVYNLIWPSLSRGPIIILITER